MQLGRHLRELWQLRIGLVVSVLLAFLAALWSVGQVGLFPPSVKPRQLEMAGASTRALVDTPKSTVLDLSTGTSDLYAITNRALLVGNIMASAPVREYIARRAHVPADVLRVASPVTPDFPRPLAVNGKPHSSDLLKSPDQYRLSIQTAAAAQQLANGAVDGMKDYLRDLGVTQHVPAEQQVHLEQLGSAKGGVINHGVSVKVAMLSFLLVFAVSSATTLYLARVQRGWAEGDRAASESWRPAGSHESGR
jgi:hypothetical protein